VVVVYLSTNSNWKKQTIIGEDKITTINNYNIKSPFTSNRVPFYQFKNQQQIIA